MGLLGVLLVGGVAWLGASWIQAIGTHYQKKEREYLKKEAHYQALMDQKPVLEQRLEQLRSSALRSRFLLNSQAPNLAQNELRKLIEELAQNKGVQLNRTRNLAKSKQDGLTRVAIQVKLQVSNMAVLRKLFYELESQKPLLFLDQVALRRYPRPLRRKTRAKKQNGSSITSQFHLSGFISDSS